MRVRKPAHASSRGRLRALGSQMALLAALGLPAVAVAAEPDAAGAKQGNWFTRAFRKDTKAPTVKDRNGQPIPIADKIPEKKKPTGSSSEATQLQLEEKQARAQRLREEANLFRRQAVCDQLKSVAAETNDEDLWRQAEELDRKAFDLFNRRVKQNVVSTLPRDADEEALDKHLGGARTGLKGRTEPLERAAQRKDRNGRAAAREDKR